MASPLPEGVAVHVKLRSALIGLRLHIHHAAQRPDPFAVNGHLALLNRDDLDPPSPPAPAQIL